MIPWNSQATDQDFLAAAKATPVIGAFHVEGQRDEGVNSYLTIAIDAADPYRSWRKLPDAVEFHGRVYGKTGYDSDKCLAYYSTRVNLAKAVR